MIIFNVDWIQALGLLIGVVLPLLVAIVTKLSTAPWEKTVLLAALAFATNIATQIDHAVVNHVAFNLGNALVLGLGTFIIAIASNLGLWNPTKVTPLLSAKIGVKDRPADQPELLP